MALQKLKGIAASQSRNVNSFWICKLSYVNSVNLHPSFLVSLDSVAANRLDKVEGFLVKAVKRLHSLTLEFVINEEDDDDDDNDDNDDDSQSSLNDCNL